MNMSSLPRAGELVPCGLRARHWRPGLAPASHSEIFASSREASGAAAAIALMLDGMRASGGDRDGRDSILWVQDDAARRLNGRPYRPGLPASLRRRVIHVAARKPEDALFALEEGVRCRDLACVIGEIAGNPRTLDFTASRRLSLAAEKHGVPLFLVRHDAACDLSSARMRWQIRSAHSSPLCWNSAAPGVSAWHGELFRARSHAPGEWIVSDDGTSLAAEPIAAKAPTPDHGDLAGAAGAGSLAAH